MNIKAMLESSSKKLGGYVEFYCYIERGKLKLCATLFNKHKSNDHSEITFDDSISFEQNVDNVIGQLISFVEDGAC